MGRDKAYASELTQDIQINAIETVFRVNELLTDYYRANPDAKRCGVNSGWRPPAVNRAAGGARLSNHMTGRAIDIGDADGRLDAWCLTPEGIAALERHGLWMEHPDATPRWAHFQTVPPRSGRRHFYP